MGLTKFPNGVSSFGVPVLPSTAGTTTGSVFFVDSGDSLASNNTSSGSFEVPFASIDYAVGKCTANNGDVIYVKPGHAETVSAAAGLDLDVAGITIIFLGEGNARGSITFGTVVGSDMDVDAADITLVNPRFIAGIDALTGPIDVNAARFKMINATWQDGTDINTTDCVVADANADDMVIDGFEFVDGNAGGTQKQSFIQVAAATRPVIKNVKCTGDFGTGIIENGTAWIDALVEDVVLDNASASPTVCIALAATSTGWVRNSSLRVASGLVGYTANNDMQFDNVNVTGTDAATAAETDPVLGSLADSAATGAVTTSDTAMAYIKQVVTDVEKLETSALGTIAAGSFAAYLPRCVEKSDGAVLTGNDNLFVITGGPVRAKIVGIVTTIIGGASNGDLQIVVTTPAGTVSLNAAPVAIDNDAAGTIYYNVGATSVFTPVTAGAVILDPVTVEETEFLLPPGTVHFRSSAAQTGVIKWYMSYVPLTPNALVTAAA